MTSRISNHIHEPWEQFLKQELFAYPSRQKQAWHRNYSSAEAYRTSVAPNRNQWQQVLQGLTWNKDQITSELEPLGDQTQRICLKYAGQKLFQAIFQTPSMSNQTPLPLIVCLHGIGGTPEMILGRDSALKTSYHDFALLLRKEGYAVLTPYLLNNFAHRARVNRLALLLGSSVWGLEIQALTELLNITLSYFPIDVDRIGIWGISMGGAYALYWLPLENRISMAIISAWFNHRLRKMAITDTHYSCFLDTEEEHAFLPGLLTQFSDEDLVSLICPRPLLIQTGRTDPVSWAPLVSQSIEAARSHYQKLDLADRIQWDLHPGGHEINLKTGIAFLNKWL